MNYYYEFDIMGVANYYHLGNVLAVVSDKKFALDNNNDGIIDYYQADVLVAQDFYPFHSIMPGRSFNSSEYRYGGAGGQEKDDEITGVTGSHYTAEYWEYDSRIGRRWNVDPVTYFWQSSYTAFNNNPIVFIDPEGLFGSRREARKYAKDNKSQFEGGRKIGKGENGEFVIQRKRDGAQFVYGAGTAGYTFTKTEKTFFGHENNFSFGRDKPLNFFGYNLFNSYGNSAIDVDNPPFSKMTIKANASYNSNGFKNKVEVGVESTCETCEDAYAKTSTSLVFDAGSKLKNPSSSDISAAIELTFKMGLNLPATNNSSVTLGGNYGPWTATYTPSTKDLTFGFLLGSKKKGFGVKAQGEYKLQEIKIAD